MRSFLAGVLAVLVAAPVASGQRLGPAPKRPRSASVPDTNDARAYLNFGNRNAKADPFAAADAFYWAARLDPTSGEALYGRAMGLVMRSRSTLRTYMRGGRYSMQSKDLRGIDSLFFYAHTTDPFLFRRLERDVLLSYYRNEVQESVRSTADEVSDTEIDHYITSSMSAAGPEMQAWLAYGEGDFQSALSLYAAAMKGTKKKAWFHTERARIFGRLAESDSAVAEFQSALKELRARDAKELVILYNSKAVLEHSIAILLEQKNDVSGAREAYGRALQEDLAYFPAHVRLGLLASTANDTATAITELELATQIAPNEPYPRFMLASGLIRFARVERALTEIQKTIELEPYWATPYAQLALLLENKGDGPAALAAYNAYFAHAAQNHPLAGQMRARLTELKDVMGVKP